MHGRIAFALYSAAVLFLSLFTASAMAASERTLELGVVEVAEKSYNNRPALAVVFSTALKSRSSFAGQLQVIDPERREVTGEWVLGSGDRVLYFPHVAPSMRYQVTVRRGLQAANGRVLANTSEHLVTTRELKPAFDFASRGSVLVPGMTEGLPIMTVEVPEVDVEFLRVDEASLSWFVTNYYRAGHADRSYALRQIAEKATSVYLARFTTEAERYARTTSHIPVFDIEELKKPGMYIAVMKAPAQFDTYNIKNTFYFVSDIAVQARQYADRLQVTATSLSDGKPMADVRLSLYEDHEEAPTHPFTGEDGTVLLPRPEKANAVLVARKGQHFTVLHLARPALDLSDFEVDGPQQKPYEAYLFSNRDLFRPGEGLDLSVLLRDGDGKAAPEMPLTVVYKQPDGREQARVTLTAEALGYYSHRFAIPADGKTGLWQAEAYIVQNEQKIGSFAFHVEEFLPERMKLELSSEQSVLAAKEDWALALDGAYLYGAPASGNRYEATLNVTRARHPFENYREFEFGDSEEDAQALRKKVAEGSLDSSGRAELKVAQPQQYRSPMRYRLSASLFEPGGRPLTRSIDTVYFPADKVVGIRPLYEGKYAKSYAPADFELVRLDKHGKPAPAKNLEVTLEREEHSYYWAYRSGNGWQRDASVSRYAEASWNVDLAENGTAQLRVPLKWGYYRVVVKDPETGLLSRYRFRAGWRNEEGKKSARPDAVNLYLDKPAYRSGDTISLKLVAPHAGRAVVRVESDRLLWQKWIDVPAAGASLAVPFDAAWDGQHDLYVSAVVYRPGDKKNRITPNRSVGVLHLPLDRQARRLETALTAPERIAPGKALDIEVAVPGAAGEEAYTVVAAVDSGILNITDFQTPEAAAHFFARRAYGVEARDLFDRVIESLEGRKAKHRFGGDADSASMARRSKQARAEVEMVAFTSSAVRLDAAGKARVSFPMPEFNGELRLMALTFSASRFGAAEGKVKVRSPVVAEITLPRFMAFDDKALGTLDLHNMSGQAQTLSLALSGDERLDIGSLPATVSMADNERQSLQFPLSAAAHFGVGKVSLALKGEGVDVQREWALGVRAPWHGDKRVVHLSLKPGATERIGLESLKGLRPATVEAVLSVAAQPPLEIRDAIQGLLRYPYGCLEQTTSAAYPHLYVDEAKAQVFGIEPESWPQRVRAVNQAVERIGGMQLANGGFALWNRSGREEPWLTPYAVDFLLQARDKGFSVPASMLDKGMDRLATMVRRGVELGGRYHSDSRAHLGFASRAYAAYILARLRRAPLGALRTLYEYGADKAESGLPLVHLGLALTLQGDSQLGAKALAAGLAKIRGHGYLGDYGSDLRDTGLILALLHRHSIELKGRDELVFELSKQVRERRYFSTQERTALFLAGDALTMNAGRQVALGIDSGKGEQRLEGEVLRHVTLREVGPGDKLRLRSFSDHPQYLTLTVTGYTLEPPPVREEHFKIERRLYTMDGQAVTGDKVEAGEFFVVHVSVNGQQWSENVLIEELLPAGFEVENLNIGRGEGLDNFTIDSINAGQAMRDEAIRHVEYRDDRFVAAVKLDRHRTLNLFYQVRAVSPGSFAYPPPLVEDMYDAERVGVGASSGRLTVERRRP